MSKITCRKCQAVFESHNKDFNIESRVCPQCGMDNRGSDVVIIPPERQQQSQEGSSSQQTRVMCDWEIDWRTNPVAAYLNTIRQVIKEPGHYFGTILPFKDYFSLAVFIYINSFVTILFTMMFQLVFTAIADPKALIGIPFMLCAIVVFPFLSTGMIFLFGAIIHFFLTYIGGSQKDYDTTMTVYGLGTAANLFGIIPFAGGIVSLVYTVMINIWGQARAHEIPTSKAALAFILPILVICCCVFTGVFALVLFVGGAGSLLEHFGDF